MQFVIGRNVLQKELAFVQGIVERKNTIPVLANILIESAGENSIRISGTDLDVTIRCDADAEEIKSQGAICVPARKLFDIARLLPDAPVSFRKEPNEWVTWNAIGQSSDSRVYRKKHSQNWQASNPIRSNCLARCWN